MCWPAMTSGAATAQARLPAQLEQARLTVSRVAQGMRVICCRATSNRVSTARMSTFRHAVVTAWNWSSSSLMSTCIGVAQCRGGRPRPTACGVTLAIQQLKQCNFAECRREPGLIKPYGEDLHSCQSSCQQCLKPQRACNLHPLSGHALQATAWLEQLQHAGGGGAGEGEGKRAATPARQRVGPASWPRFVLGSPQSHCNTRRC